MATPIHWRMPTLKPKIRSAMTARITTPVESTAWTTESGANASAATWNSHATAAMPMPIANHLHEYSCTAVRNGCRMSTVGSVVGALVLIEKAQLRGDRAGQREQDAQIQRHVSSYVDSLKIPRPPCPEGNGLPGESSSTSVPDPQPLSADRARLAVVMKVPSRTRAKLPHMVGRPILSLTLAAALLAGCGGEAAEAKLKANVRYAKGGGIAGVSQQLTVRPDGTGVAASHEQRRSFKVSAATRRAIERAVRDGGSRPHEEPEASAVRARTGSATASPTARIA